MTDRATAHVVAADIADIVDHCVAGMPLEDQLAVLEELRDQVAEFIDVVKDEIREHQP
jgi:hypothetical protein